ncbi:efflux RND transporter periplasmic adaptor subunit [Indioceanicola profundi]|uniref:efflux RND transporter periplasmic adaptor subunit n=1 Tax=Indioceanicola profundi TaxID=2220096 RepID=UPI000E6ACF50|nr:efflux RND transporter periplasmic adaptor subunit [Indioceanicola profundi]
MKKIVIGVSVLALMAAGIGYWSLNQGSSPIPTASTQEAPAAGDNHEHGEEDEHAHEEGGANDSHGSAGEDAHGHGDEHGHEDAHGHEDEEGAIHLTEAQIGRSNIKVVEAGPSEVSTEVQVMGTIVPDADRMAHVTTRVPGVVAEVLKRLGDQVAAGDVLAVLDSRDLAEAKADYLAALRQEALASTTLKREEDLRRKKVSAEQDYLDASTAAETSRIALDVARQRLATLGLTDAELEALPKQDPRAMSRLEVRAPMSGRVTERNAVRGELVSAEKEIFTVADLSTVWVNLPVYASDIPQVREGQVVTVKGPAGQTAQGKVIFTGPTIDPQTGAARVVASLENPDGTWRPGDFVSGAIASGGEPADVAVPASALQTLNGEIVVFVRNEEGFETRVVEVGRRSSSTAEIVFGLFPGDPVASGNTFLLKAEASRGAAEHSHSH